MGDFKKILVYKDAYKTGEQYILTIPTNRDYPSSSKTYYSNSWEDAFATYSWLDSNDTIFINLNSYYADRLALLQEAYPNVFLLSTTADEVYYLNDSFNIYTHANGGIEFRNGDSILWSYNPPNGVPIQIPTVTGETYSGSLAYVNITPYYTSSGDFSIQISSNIYSSGITKKIVYDFWNAAEEAPEDPYAKGGTSDIGGGTGTFSGTGDSIDFPNLPTLSAVSTGFITLFNPSIAQMQSLATYMWSDVFDIGLYKTLFADPMDCILGCSIVPVAVPNGGTKTVNVGNVSTGISMTVAASQYVEVDCGTLNVEEYWGSYLDYDPYTKAEIYLPYCGTHALQVDDIMGKAVHVKYHVDILSGACCAYVKCGSSVMYSFVGQCSSSIPISANDWTNVVNGALTIAASVGSLIATGGASAPMAVGAAAAVTGTIYGGGIKQNVEKSGSMGGTGGMLAVQTPYLILTRPRQALPKKQNTYTGYPSFITTKLSDLKGYTEIDSIRITGVPATDAELNELESILKSGVIF